VSIVVGIDSGAGGAIAFLESETNELLHIEDMPVDRTQVGKSVRSRISRSRLLALLMRVRGAAGFVERPIGFPLRQTNKKTGQTESRQPGAAGMLAMGENYGAVIMGCTAAEISLTEVRPGVWKRALSVPAAKDDARRRAAEIWPIWAAHFARVKDDGKAESALLALYGSRVLRGELRNAAALISAD
jgi:crossover junction endodeoxyribonuclease RuvC